MKIVSDLCVISSYGMSCIEPLPRAWKLLCCLHASHVLAVVARDIRESLPLAASVDLLE